MPAPTTIRLFGMVDDSIVDGPGMRFSVFVQGCSHHCTGCHNPESWSFNAGEEVCISDVVNRALSNKLTSGVTLSGGDPFDQAAECAEIARCVKQAGRNVWVYTGYEYEDLLQQIETLSATDNVHSEAIAALLSYADVLVDGPFEQDKRSLDLHYCGSSNQRLIDMNKTRKTGRVVLWQNVQEYPTKPPSW